MDGEVVIARAHYHWLNWVVPSLALIVPIVPEPEDSMEARTSAPTVSHISPAFFAKVLVLAVSTFLVGLVSIIVTALVTMPILSSKGINPDFLDGEVVRALLGGAVYLTLIAVLAFGFGAILRSSAAGIASALGLLLVIPPVLTIVSALTRAEWVHNVSVFLPSSAGARMFSLGEAISVRGGPPGAETPLVASDALTLDPTQGFLVLMIWVVVLLTTAAVLVKRRDA